MRQFCLGILCSAAFLATACNKSSDNQAPADLNAGGEQGAAAADEYFTVRAGPVANAKISALAGNFQMLKVAAAIGIPSKGSGGACLTFAAADLGFAKMATTKCTTNTDCYTRENGNDGMPASAAYCDAPTRSCWAKPKSQGAANALCNKGKIFPASKLNPVPDPPDGSGQIDVSKWVKPGAKVRVVACVQKPYTGPPPPPCGQVESADRIEVLGPVATVKP